MKILISVVLIFIFITGIPACVGEVNPCGNVPPFFRITRINNTEMRISNSGPDIIIPPSGTGTFSNHFFQTDFAVSYYATNTQQPQQQPLFINTAYATSCVDEGYMGCKEGIDTVFFITTVDIDSTLAANDTINNAIFMANNNSSFLPVQEYIKANKGGVANTIFQWKLMRKPADLSVAYFFKVVVRLSNGDEFSTVTAPYFFN
jgi:hypothetical protein